MDNVEVVEDGMPLGVAVGTDPKSCVDREDVAVVEMITRSLLERRRGRECCPVKGACTAATE